MRSSCALLLVLLCLCSTLAQQIPVTYETFGPRSTAISYAGTWNNLLIELPGGPETSDLTLSIDLVDGKLPTTYFGTSKTTRDPASTSHFEFVIPAGQASINLYTYTYRARDDSDYPGNLYQSNDNYQLSGPVQLTTLALNVVPRVWNARLIPGTADVSGPLVTGRVGDSCTLELSLADTNHTLDETEPIGVMLSSLSVAGKDLFNSIGPLELTIPALAEAHNFTLTLSSLFPVTDPPSTTDAGQYLVQPTWIYYTQMAPFYVSVVGGRDAAGSLMEIIDGVPSPFAGDVFGYPGDSFEFELPLKASLGEVPAAGAVMRIVPHNPDSGWNFKFVGGGGGPQFTIPASAFRADGNGSFVFGGNLTLPESMIEYDIIFESPAGFDSISSAFTVIVNPKTTVEQYPFNEEPAMVAEWKFTGYVPFYSTGNPLPGDSFAITLHPNDVEPYASEDIEWTLVVVPTDAALNDHADSYTITSGQATQSAFSNDILSPPFSGTFNKPGIYQLCVLPSTAEYLPLCKPISVNVACSTSQTGIMVDTDPSSAPDSFTVALNAFDASQFPITMSINDADVAELSPYLEFLNTSVSYQPDQLGNNRFYFRHVAFPPTQGSEYCVRVESSFQPQGHTQPAYCGKVCFTWPTYSVSLSPVDADFGESTPHVGDTISLILSHDTEEWLPDVTYTVSVDNDAWSLVTTTPLTLSSTVRSLPVVFQYDGWTTKDGICSAKPTTVSVGVPAGHAYISAPPPDVNLLGNFDPTRLIVVASSLGGETAVASCGSYLSMPYRYVRVGDVVPLWVRLNTDSDFIMSSPTDYTVSIAPYQPDRVVNIGTWDRQSFVIADSADWQLQNFTFTATRPGTAAFVITADPAEFMPFLFKIEVKPELDAWDIVLPNNMYRASLGEMTNSELEFRSSAYNLGQTTVSRLGLSREDNDKKLRIEQFGSANVSILYPQPDADGWITVKRGTQSQVIVWTCNSIGEAFFHIYPAETYPVYMGTHMVISIRCIDTMMEFVPSRLPVIERGQKVELTVVAVDQAPKTGRNESRTIALATGAESSLIGLAEIHLSDRQLILGQNEFYKTFAFRAKSEGVATIWAYGTEMPENDAGLTVQIGRSAADHTWTISMIGGIETANEYFTFQLCNPANYHGVFEYAVAPIELPIAFDIVFSGEAAVGASLVSENFVDASPNPQYWTTWSQDCVTYTAKATRAGVLEIGVVFANYTVGTGKKAITWQQSNPFPVTITVVDPTMIVDYNNAAPSSSPSLAFAGDYIDYFVWHPNPQTNEDDGGFTLIPLQTQSQFGGQLAASATNVRTGATIADVFATGIRITPTDTEFVIRMQQVASGTVNIVWETSTPGYEPRTGSSSHPFFAQTWKLSETDLFGSAFPPMVHLSSNLGNLQLLPGIMTTVQFTRDVTLSSDSSYTISIPAPSADILSFEPSTFTIPAGLRSASVQVTVTGYGMARVLVQPDDTATHASYAWAGAIGDTLSLREWERFMREDRVFTFYVERSDNIMANFYQDLQVQVIAVETSVDGKSEDNVVWGFALIDDDNQPIPDNIVTIPAGISQLPLRAVVNATTNEVTMVRVTAVQGPDSGYTGNFLNLYESYPLVSKKVLTLLNNPRIGDNGTAELIWIHCPSESIGAETFDLYPHGSMGVWPRSFRCTSSTSLFRLWIWGEANRMDIVSNSQRAAYDPREDLSDMAILQLQPIGNNKKSQSS